MSSTSESIAEGSPAAGVPSAITDVLGSLKRRIRTYVVVEGTAMVLVLLALLFWISLGLDWAWFRVSRLELPVWFRAVFDVLVVQVANLALVWLL